MYKKIIVCLGLVSLFVFPSSVSASYDQSSAESYLVAHSNNPWSTMALSAIGSDSIPSDYLKSVSGSSAIEYAAPILAITSLQQDPRKFGNKDLIAELEKFHTQNQIGDDTTINDDIFGLLALISAGVKDDTTSDAKNFILANQQTSGGWGFSTDGGTDSNTTAAAIVALKAARLSKSSP